MAKDDKNKIAPISLDMSLDDIEDMPGFLTPPSGAYQCETLVLGDQKDAGDHPAFACKWKITEVHEITGELNDGESPPKSGDEFELLFMRDNKFGADQFKQILKSYAEKVGSTNIAQICSEGKGMHVMMIINRTHNKEKDRDYCKIKKLAVV